MNSVRSLTLFLLASFVESTIPRVREEELRRAVIDHDQHWIAQNLRDVGGKYSAFYISVDDMAFTESSRRLQDLTEEEKECIFGDPSNWMLPLTDGTTRTTFATEVGHYPECARKVMDPMSEGFSSIEILVSNTIERIAGRPLEFSSEDVVVTRLHEAPHKDHIHLYTKSASSVENGTQFMVPFHTDNGIFLIITPTQIQPLQIQLSTGEVVETSDAPAGSVLVLIGLGLTDWMFQGHADRNQFFPVPHGVPALAPGKDRVVFARMKTAPGMAIPTLHPTFPSHTFNDVFMRTSSLYSSKDSQICTSTLDHWTKAMDDRCAEHPGTAYCWMTCLALDPNCTVEMNLCIGSDGHHCTDNDMDNSCQWTCPYCLNNKPEEPPQDPPNDFCVGATDMLMGGFSVSGNPSKQCIILFFEPWTLSTPLKFGLGCFGVFLLGFSIEVVIAIRRKVSEGRSGSSFVMRAAVLFCFGLNLILGYLAMLVAMTYSVELFLCVCLGIVFGHGILNDQTPVGESIDPCCAVSQNPIAETEVKTEELSYVLHTPPSVRKDSQKCCKSDNVA